MPKFRKRPVEIEAREFTGGRENGEALAAWAREYDAEIVWDKGFYDAKTRVEAMYEYPEHLRISTLEGNLTAQVGSMIIRGVENEFYACEPGIFKQTYERVYEGLAPFEDPR